MIVPGVVQQFQVSPNVPDKEGPYLAKNIEATRAAYGLDACSAEAAARQTVALEISAAAPRSERPTSCTVTMATSQCRCVRPNPGCFRRQEAYDFGRITRKWVRSFAARGRFR